MNDLTTDRAEFVGQLRLQLLELVRIEGGRLLEIKGKNEDDVSDAELVNHVQTLESIKLIRFLIAYCELHPYTFEGSTLYLNDYNGIIDEVQRQITNKI